MLVIFKIEKGGRLAFETMRQASRALSLLPQSDHLSRGPASALLGLAYWSIGDLQSAHKSLAQGMASLRKAGNITFAISGTCGLADITLTLHKKLAKNRFAAFIAASKGQYSFFLELTMSDMARPRRKLRLAFIYRSKCFFPQSFMQR